MEGEDMKDIDSCIEIASAIGILWNQQCILQNKNTPDLTDLLSEKLDIVAKQEGSVYDALLLAQEELYMCGMTGIMPVDTYLDFCSEHPETVGVMVCDPEGHFLELRAEMEGFTKQSVN